MLLEAPPQQEATPQPPPTSPELEGLAVLDGPDVNDAEDLDDEIDTETEDAEGDVDANSNLSPLESLLAIRKARELCRQCMAEWKSAKADAREAKKAYDAAVIRLNSLIDGGPKIAAAPSLAEGEIDSSPEAWRTITVEELGLAQGICDVLRKAEISTLGAIADWTNERLLTEIKGVGVSKAEVIEQACEQYWRDHPEHTH